MKILVNTLPLIERAFNKVLIEEQKAEIKSIVETLKGVKNTFMPNFELIEVAEDRLLIKETNLDQWSKFEFTIQLGENFKVVEVFDNPADEWEEEYNSMDEFNKRLIALS